MSTVGPAPHEDDDPDSSTDPELFDAEGDALPAGELHAVYSDDDDEDGEEFILRLAFDSDEPEFCRGFEAGVIWMSCATNGNFHGMMHSANAEMVLRIAESLHLPVKAEPTSVDEWMTVTIGDPA